MPRHVMHAAPSQRQTEAAQANRQVPPPKSGAPPPVVKPVLTPSRRENPVRQAVRTR